MSSMDEAIKKREEEERRKRFAKIYREEYAEELKYMLGKHNNYLMVQTQALKYGYITDIIRTIQSNLLEYDYNRKVFLWFEKKTYKNLYDYLVLVVKIGRRVNRINLRDIIEQGELQEGYLQALKVISEESHILDEYNLEID